MFTKQLYDPLTGDVTSEVKYLILQQYWQRHCKSFSEWFLQLNNEIQHQYILESCPDIPAINISIREQIIGEFIKPSDIILPELSLDQLVALNGKVLVLLFTRRCVSTDLCYDSDLKLINTIYLNEKLPEFSNGRLKAFKEPFIDPLDESEIFQSLPPDANETLYNELVQHFSTGRLIRAECWLALKIRRLAILNFLVSLIEKHQETVKNKPSPTFKALLEGEIKQRQNLEELHQHQQQELQPNQIKEKEISIIEEVE